MTPQTLRTRRGRLPHAQKRKIELEHIREAVKQKRVQLRHILPGNFPAIPTRWNRQEQIPHDVQEHMVDCARKIPNEKEINRLWVNNEIRHAWIMGGTEGKRASYAIHHFSTKKELNPYREGVTWLDEKYQRTTEKKGKYLCIAVIAFGIPGQFFGTKYYSAYFIEKSKLATEPTAVWGSKRAI